MQIGSKALSNVAGQFSKLGQTLNPAKIRSTKKTSGTITTAQLGYDNHSGTLIDSPTKKTTFTVGKPRRIHSAGGSSGAGAEESMSDSDDECNIFEPDVSDLVQENPIYNENVFLPSVGIVMAPNDNNRQNVAATDSSSSNVYGSKMSADVCTMSISSVTDHIIMPPGMLENASPVRARSPAPEIRVQNICIDEMNLVKSSGHHFSHSSGEMNAAASNSSGSGDLR